MDWQDAQKVSNASYVIGMAIGGLITALGMHAENQQRIQNGESIAYTAESFNQVVLDYQCHHNAIVTNQMNGL